MTIRERSVCKGLVDGWMFADGMQHPAQVEEFRSIQVQGCHGCSSYCSAPYEVLAPDKVLCPTLATRMKKWHKASCLWIWHMDLRVLACVTPRARPRKIIQCRLTTGLAGVDMLAVKGCSGKESGTAAVFTQPSRPGAHLATQGGRNVLTWHWLRYASRVPP